MITLKQTSHILFCLILCFSMIACAKQESTSPTLAENTKESSSNEEQESLRFSSQTTEKEENEEPIVFRRSEDSNFLEGRSVFFQGRDSFPYPGGL